MLQGEVEPKTSYYSKEMMLLMLGCGFAFTLIRAQRRVRTSEQKEVETDVSLMCGMEETESRINTEL